jgi:hypothetical protein
MGEHNIFDFEPDEDPQIQLYEGFIEDLRRDLTNNRGDNEECAKIKREIIKRRKKIRAMKKEKGIV